MVLHSIYAFKISIMLSKESAYIRSLAPLTFLPPSLVRTTNNERPPVMRFGWVLNDTVKARLREIARNDPECYVYGNPYGNGFDDDATDSDLGCPPGLSGIPRARVDDYCTMDLAAESVLRALGISLPGDQYIELVSTRDEEAAVCFALYTNYELDKDLPTRQEVQDICERLGLEGNPQWWPELEFQWVNE